MVSLRSGVAEDQRRDPGHGLSDAADGKVGSARGCVEQLLGRPERLAVVSRDGLAHICRRAGAERPGEKLRPKAGPLANEQAARIHRARIDGRPVDRRRRVRGNRRNTPPRQLLHKVAQGDVRQLGRTRQLGRNWRLGRRPLEPRRTDPVHGIHLVTISCVRELTRCGCNRCLDIILSAKAGVNLKRGRRGARNGHRAPRVLADLPPRRRAAADSLPPPPR